MGNTQIPAGIGAASAQPGYPGFATTFITQTESEVSALAKKHVTLTYSILGVLVLTLALAAFGGWLGIRGYQQALQRAEAAEQVSKQREDQFLAQMKSYSDALAQSEAQRQAQQQQIASLQAGITARATQPLPVVIQTGLKPDATAQAVAAALASAYSNVPAFTAPVATPTGEVSVTASNAQILVQNKVDLDRMTLDYKDLTQISDLQKAEITSLTGNLSQCQDVVGAAKETITAQQTTIADYKKAATKSKWQKVWGGIKSVAIPAAAYFIGRGKL